MIPRRTLVGSAVALSVTALTIAGCGGGGESTPAAAVKSPTPRGGGPAVDVGSTKLGKILVDSQGRTLYLFEKDTGAKSTCFGACTTVWPPFRTNGKPKAGNGVKAALLGTTARSDGKPQATYNGHPLYYYAGDQKAGETNGEGLTQFGAEWYVLSPAGNSVEGNGSGSSTTGGGNGGY